MTSINGETGKNGFKLRLDYEVTKQSTADNKSAVHMVLYCTPTPRAATTRTGTRTGA